MFSSLRHIAVVLIAGFLHSGSGSEGATFKVATYNLENYVIQATRSRTVKSPESRAKVQETILALKADVLALQEIGPEDAFQEMRSELKSKGLDYPYWEHVKGFDTNVFVGVLSRFPFSDTRSHTKDSYLLNGRRFQVSRGFAEVDIKVTADYSFTLMTGHLKSKRTIPEADEAEMRLEEAKLLREKVDARLSGNPETHLVVLGDFNDTKDSASIRTLIGRGRLRLVDTRPAERNGDNLPSSNPAWEPRNITWTHYYGKEDSYSRVDYLLLSPGMAETWVKNESFIVALPNWGLASDHRPLVATFTVPE